MYVISGSASKSVASHLVRELSASLADVEIRRFADGECYVRIKTGLKGEDVVIVQNTYPDENIVEAILLKSAVRDMDPNSLILVIPYYGYARQDRKFQDGEAISAKILAKIIGADTDLVITVDPHKDHIIDFFDTKALSCSAVPEIANYLLNKGIDVVIAPDRGALERAKRAAKILDCDSDFLEKRRISDEIVEMTPKSIEVKGKVIAIIDDIISTGGTMAKAVEEMKKRGARKIFVACTHGLFINNALEKMIKAGADEIVSTDTIENVYSKVKIAPQIAKVIK